MKTKLQPTKLIYNDHYDTSTSDNLIPIRSLTTKKEKEYFIRKRYRPKNILPFISQITNEDQRIVGQFNEYVQFNILNHKLTNRR